jgi:cytochrome c biogenesis protein CcmG/thiol:disulfide interchange protein DsbE
LNPSFWPAVIAAVASAAPSPAGTAGARLRIGDPVPLFDVASLTGDRLRQDHLTGHVTVVEFFATWCGPCGRGLEDLTALQQQLGPAVSLVIIAVDDETKVRAHFTQHPAPPGTRIALDPQHLLQRLWGQDRFPTSYFVDAAGIVRHINRGHGPGYRARASGWLQAMLRDDEHKPTLTRPPASP